MQNIFPQIWNGFWEEAVDFFSILLVLRIDNFFAQFLFHFAVFRKNCSTNSLFFEFHCYEFSTFLIIESSIHLSFTVFVENDIYIYIQIYVHCSFLYMYIYVLRGVTAYTNTNDDVLLLAPPQTNIMLTNDTIKKSLSYFLHWIVFSNRCAFESRGILGRPILFGWCCCARLFVLTSGDSFMGVTWLICMCAVTHVWYCCARWSTDITWFVCMETVTHSYVCRDSFACAPWLIRMGGNAACNYYNAHAITRADIIWLIYIFGMTHLYVCHDSFVSVPWLIPMGGDAACKWLVLTSGFSSASWLLFYVCSCAYIHENICIYIYKHI